MENKLNAKNLITVGIFTALYFILFFATGMIGYIPVMMLFLPLLCPLVTGIPFMLFLTKVKAFGMVTVMGTILGVLMFVTGHPWPILVLGLLCGLISDIILKSRSYKGWKTSVIGYAVFSEWVMGAVLPLFFMRDAYFAQIRAGYGDTYADTLLSITPNWVAAVMIVLVVVGAVAGAFLGRAVLKKHFKRAGIA
jgi:energy-coupling factor transport system substrate-specific component